MVFEPIQRNQLHDEVVKQLRDSIDSGALKPGERLPSERELAGALEVSRNVLREALRVLEATGLVFTKQGVGRVVRGLDDDHPRGASLTDSLELATIDEVLETRVILECEIVALACERRTDAQAQSVLRAASRQETWQDNLQFHVLIAECTHNTVLESLVFEHMERLNRLGQRDRYYSPQDAGLLLSEHTEIAMAISKQDGAKGSELMRQHILDTRDRIARASDVRTDSRVSEGS
ncbi:MAG TPA: FadR/GntR family transcriptional regulator [Acidimicrobiia bacterium]|nr:FadR/GntR family transcriptional regulator [Acidimicrobiia bacterium]